MDNRNNGKMQSAKKRGKGVCVAKTKKAKIEIYATVDFLQSCFFNNLEGLKIPFNRSGEAVLEKSPDFKITFYRQKDPPKKTDLSKRAFGQKGIKGARRHRSRPVAPPRQHEAKAEFRELFH